jgi:uncharacterized protein YbjT (DUF2867 family)
MLTDSETGAALHAMQQERQVPRILLLGATGNVGRHALTSLAALSAASSLDMRLLVGTRYPEKFWSSYRHPSRCPAVVEPLLCDLGDADSVVS